MTEVTGAVREAVKCPVPGHKSRAYKAAVRLAENLAGAGQKNAASRLYRAVQAGDAEGAQKKAAGMGLKALG